MQTASAKEVQTMRMIDADALAEAMGVKRLMIQSWKADSAWGVPIVDAEPVRHGWWIKNDNGTWSCERCHSWIPDEQHYYARFCLYCGAKMDGGVDG